MKKSQSIKGMLFVVSLVLIVSVPFCCIYINYSMNLTKQKFKTEVELYLKKKYGQEMIVSDNVTIGDIKSVQVYPSSNPEIKFFVIKEKRIYDTYLMNCLIIEAENLLKDLFLQYDPEIWVSELKWCNPTPDGKNETFFYLDELYKSYGRVLSWKDINEYQKIEVVEIIIKSTIDDENTILHLVEEIKSTGCKIETLQIRDAVGNLYEYTV